MYRIPMNAIDDGSSSQSSKTTADMYDAQAENWS